jgi:transcriptional regulator with PAS, ATPase and Fis domain
MIGRHPLMLALYGAIERAAVIRAPVLIEGATGVGKDLVAQAVHALSGVAGPLVVLNVTTLPDTLVESELFGAVRGAYTGSVVDREGVVGAAAGGTLFLDEAGDLTHAVQAKLLRTLEAGQYRPVGAGQERRASFRLIMTIQESPMTLLATDRWRADFYYRIAGLALKVPSLRARPTDIPLLASHLLSSMVAGGCSAPMLRELSEYEWPGNIRQLKRAIERAVFHAGHSAVTPEAILEAAREMDPACRNPSAVRAGARPTLLAQERERIVEALASTRSTREAAGCLGLSVYQLYRRLRRHDIPAPHSRE